MTDIRASSNLQIPNKYTQPEQMADAYAERLMDELFDGVERVLAGDAEALNGLIKSESAETTFPPEVTLKFTEGGMPSVLLDAGTEGGELAPLPSVLTPPPESKIPSEGVPSVSRGWQRFWTLNRALLGAAGLCVLATVGLWLHQRRQLTDVASAPAPVPTDTSVAQADAEFLQYLQRSLDVIAQNAPETATATTSASDVAIGLNGAGATLPPVSNNALPTPPNGLPSTPGSINVIERVYVPYPSAQVPVSGTPVPSTPVTQGSPPPTVGTIASGAGSVSAATVAPHTLLGLLELGDSSAALFEIDGVPQRVYIGERIGNSGWSLVSVANEEAVIRRNGEVRSLYIGQQF